MDPQNFNVTLNDPAAAPAAPATPAADAPLVDSKGRRLVLRELSLLEEQDLIAAMPPTHAANQLVLGRALLAARVASIDGAPCEIPLTASQYRFMLHQIGKEGLNAIYTTLPKPADDAGQDGTERAKN